MLACIALLVLAAGSQASPQTAAAQATFVRGTVVRLTDSQPIAGARVTLSPPGTGGRGQRGAAPPNSNQPTATTDSAGRFTLANVAPGNYSLTVQSDGYFAARTAAGEYPAAAVGDVVVPQQGLDVSVRLVPGSTIAGTIRDASGRPASNITATLYRATYQNGRPSLQQVATRDTDDRGQFRLFRVSPGDYYLAATPSQPAPPRGAPAGQRARGTSSATPREVPYKTYYPGVIDVRDATPITLRGGEELNSFSFILRSAVPVKLSGQLTGARGAANLYLVPRDRSVAEGPIAGINVEILNGDALESRFEINGVMPGFYDLVAVLSNGTAPARGRGDRGQRGERGRGQRGGAETLSGLTLIGRVPVNVGAANVEGIAVPLEQAGEIRGRLTLDGTPFSGLVTVALQGDEHLQDITGVQTARGIRGRGQGDAEENPLSLRVIPNVPYRFLVNLSPVAVEGPPDRPLYGAYVADVLLNGRSVFDSGFTAGGGAAGQFEVVLRKGAAKVTGTVLGADRKPVAGATVVLAPPVERRQNLNLYSTATADNAGRFELRGIAPGTYKIFALDSLPPGAFQSSNVIARYEDRGATATVRPGENLSGDLILIER